MAKKKTAKKTTKKKTVKKAEPVVESSRRGSLPTKDDAGFNVIENSDVSVMSITTLHIVTGKGKETIRQRIATLPPAYSGNGKNAAKYYDPKKALPLVYEKDFEKAPKKDDDPDRGLNDPKFRKDMAAAEKAELELAETKKQVVRVDDIIEQVAEEYALLRQRLLAIPARVAKKILLAETEDEALEMLKEEIGGALRELNADSENKLKVLNQKEN